MILLGIWLGAALLVGAAWAIAGLLLREWSENEGATGTEADDEAA